MGMRIEQSFRVTRRVLLVLVLLGLSASAALAGQFLDMRDDREGYLLAPYMEILTDPSRSLTLAQVRHEPWSGRFQPTHDTPTLRLGITHAAIWLRFRLDHPPWGKRYFLEMDSAHIQQLDTYLPISPTMQGKEVYYQRIAAGSEQPRAGRPIPFRTFVIPLGATASTDGYYYLRLMSSGAMVVRPYLWSEQGLIQRVNLDNTFFGVVYGVLVAMLLANLFFFVALRDPVYLLYVVYVGTMLVFETCVYGQWDLWLPNPWLPGKMAIWAASGLVTVFAVLFSRSFLRVRSYSPLLNKIFLTVLGVGVGVVVLALAGKLVWAGVVAHIIGLIGPVFMIWAAIAAWRRGYWPARFFLLAWTVLMVALFMLAVKGFGYLPQAISSTYTLPLATAIEAVLLSLALAERVRNLRHRGEEAERRERRFHQMSMTDELTGLYNKRFFDSRLRSEMDHALRSGGALSLLVVDVDGFKQYNDTHGHTEGDKVLQALAQVLRERVRSSDFPCRYGGDEFVVIMPTTEPEQAKLAAERVRAGFHDHPFHPGENQTVWTSLSAGLAQYHPNDTSEQFMRRADAAMYQAKRDGGNRCAHA